MTIKFIKKIKNRLSKMQINDDNNVFLIYDEESELSKKLWYEVINSFLNTKQFKISKDRFWKIPNQEEIEFIKNINWICFIFFSDKWINFKDYLWTKLRDYLIWKDIITIEVWRLKYFDTEKLQKKILIALEESISLETEQKWILLEKIFTNTQKISINDTLFYEWPFEDLKYNFWLYNWEKNTLKWSLYPVWEVLSELKDLTKVNWKILIYWYPNIKNEMIYLQTPKYVYIKNWFLEKHELWKEFDEVLKKIKDLEPNNNWIIVREMWFSINKNIKKEFNFPEISSAEKCYWYHISLWWRYWVYNKLNKIKDQKIHVDIMVELENIKFDNEVIFLDWRYFFDK